MAGTGPLVKAAVEVIDAAGADVASGLDNGVDDGLGFGVGDRVAMSDIGMPQ
jgi:hypothetical protein